MIIPTKKSEIPDTILDKEDPIKDEPKLAEYTLIDEIKNKINSKSNKIRHLCEEILKICEEV